MLGSLMHSIVNQSEDEMMYGEETILSLKFQDDISQGGLTAKDMQKENDILEEQFCRSVKTLDFEQN